MNITRRSINKGILAASISPFIHGCSSSEPEEIETLRLTITKSLDQPILTRELALEQGDIANPDVWIDQTGKYRMLYSAWPSLDRSDTAGQWVTMLASSSDGVQWEKHGVQITVPNHAVYIAANGGSVELRSGKILTALHVNTLGNHAVTGAPLFGTAGSPRIEFWMLDNDGTNASKIETPIITHGPINTFDELLVADPYLTRLHTGELALFVVNDSRSTGMRMSAHTSTDEGKSWTRAPNLLVRTPSNTDLDFTAQGEPAVAWIPSVRAYLLVYVYTFSWTNQRRGLMYAWSNNPLDFRNSKVHELVIPSYPWSKQVIIDPTLVALENGTIQLWYCGGNVASADQGMNGQIGYAELVASRA